MARIGRELEEIIVEPLPELPTEDPVEPVEEPIEPVEVSEEAPNREKVPAK